MPGMSILYCNNNRLKDFRFNTDRFGKSLELISSQYPRFFIQGNYLDISGQSALREQLDILKAREWWSVFDYYYFRESPQFAADEAFILYDDEHYGNKVLFKYNGPGGDLVIPDDLPVAKIGNGAFGNRVDITSATIPDGVTSINPFAFFGCVNLTAAVIPESVGEISGDAFQDCENLTIYSPQNSYAHNYAAEHGINWRNMDVAEPCKKSGAIVTAPAEGAKTANSITAAPSIFTGENPGSQTIEYAISRSASADPETLAWQSGTTFSGLSSNTAYYIYARSKENEDRYAAAAAVSAGITTNRSSNSQGHNESQTVTYPAPANTPRPTPEMWQNPFNDINEDDWFYNDIKYAVENGLFNGTGGETFEPDATMTRGMFVTVLWRMAGNAAADINHAFADVQENMYYAEAVKWAAEKGIVSGGGDRLFSPDEKITREQMAVMLYNYEQSSGKIPADIVVDREFTDWNEISDWAKNAVNVLVIQGVLIGKPGNLFVPQGTATRAEAAAMLHRFDV
jgi:hypothetical protein